MNKLIEIQQKLKAPKDLYNSFGGYSYRSAESILQALKPLLEETKTCLILNDELQNIGERYYVKATATLYDLETGLEIASTSSFAREEETKKGMDGSQITGASSSYARKYALNGMFLIDDVKDSDATNTHDEQPQVSEETHIEAINNSESLQELIKYFNQNQKSFNGNKAIMKAFQDKRNALKKDKKDENN